MPIGSVLAVRGGESVQHIVSVSGGKDSTATYLLAMEHGRPFRAVFADTGNEHPITLDYVANLAQVTGGPQVETVVADFTEQLARKRATVVDTWMADGVPWHLVWRAYQVLKPTGNPYLDLVLWKGRFPSARAQFCTEELKTIPVTDQIVRPALKNGPVLQWIGVRADESLRRSKLRRFERDDIGSWIWRPIFRQNVEWVFAMHRKHGIEPNPLYKMGMGRVGCMPCINCDKNELRVTSNRFPEQIDRIEEWEELATLASKCGGTSFFTSTDDPAYTGGKYTIRDAVAWSQTTRGGRQGSLINLVAQTETAQCASKYGLCE